MPVDQSCQEIQQTMAGRVTMQHAIVPFLCPTRTASRWSALSLLLVCPSVLRTCPLTAVAYTWQCLVEIKLVNFVVCISSATTSM